MASSASRLAIRVVLLATLLSPTVGPILFAQVTPPADGRTVTPRDTANPERHQTLFTYRDGMLAAAFVGLTFAMFPVDRHVAQQLQKEDYRENKLLDQTATGVEWITTPGSFFIGGGLYAVGKVTNHKDLADLGWHGTEAIILGSGITSFLKGTLGRARPYVSHDSNTRDFKFLRGFGRGNRDSTFGSGDYQSFPSGHTTTAFAAASAVTSEARRIWPQSVKFVAPVMYGGATLVGLSRMYHNNHWASDVALGAAVGTFSGLKVVRYSHAHPDNKLDQWILNVTVAPDGRGGTALGFVIPFD